MSSSWWRSSKTPESALLWVFVLAIGVIEGARAELFGLALVGVLAIGVELATLAALLIDRRAP
ncbi:MAG: hypothetical protein V3S03_08520 [Vicinamibacteria bacterium]